MECGTEVEEECRQAINVARAAVTVPMEMTILWNDTNASCEACAPLEPHARKCVRV